MQTGCFSSSKDDNTIVTPCPNKIQGYQISVDTYLLSTQNT